MPPLADRRLAQRDVALVDQKTDLAGIGEIDHRGEQRDGRELVLAARRQHACGAAQDGAADAEAQRMNLVDAGDVAHDVDRFQRAER